MLSVKNSSFQIPETKLFFAGSGGFSDCFTTYTARAPMLRASVSSSFLNACHEPSSEPQGKDPSGRCPEVLPCMGHF